MINSIQKKQSSIPYKVICGFIAVTFLTGVILPPTPVRAQTVFNLPVPGTMVTPSAGFVPTRLIGVTIHPDNPLKFDFIVNTGDSNLTDQALKEESRKLIKYFLASLTVPEDELWVNLSPYEKDRMIPQGLGQTEMGRDMLVQDYLLKQLTASLMYPEKELGKKFWEKIYKEVREQYGTTEIPVNTFNKVWVVPQEAVVYEKDTSAFVVKSRLKVMLESDYEAMSHQSSDVSHQKNETLTTEDRRLTTQIIKEVIIPAIEQEVNEGENFANLRQMYNSLILAAWYKQKLIVGAENFQPLLGQIYVDQNKTKGIDTQDKTVNQKIYDQYIESFKKGVYNYIKEDIDPATQDVIPRKYFSGGLGFKIRHLVMATLMVWTLAQSAQGEELIKKASEKGQTLKVGTMLGENPTGEITALEPPVTTSSSPAEPSSISIQRIQEVREFLRNDPSQDIVGLVIFGSVAAGTARPESDLDYIPVKRTGAISLSDQLEQADLEFHQRLKRQFDYIEDILQPPLILSSLSSFFDESNKLSSFYSIAALFTPPHVFDAFGIKKHGAYYKTDAFITDWVVVAKTPEAEEQITAKINEAIQAIEKRSLEKNQEGRSSSPMEQDGSKENPLWKQWLKDLTDVSVGARRVVTAKAIADSLNEGKMERGMLNDPETVKKLFENVKYLFSKSTLHPKMGKLKELSQFLEYKNNEGIELFLDDEMFPPRGKTKEEVLYQLSTLMDIPIEKYVLDYQFRVDLKGMKEDLQSQNLLIKIRAAALAGYAMAFPSVLDISFVNHLKPLLDDENILVQQVVARSIKRVFPVLEEKLSRVEFNWLAQRVQRIEAIEAAEEDQQSIEIFQDFAERFFERQEEKAQVLEGQVLPSNQPTEFGGVSKQVDMLVQGIELQGMNIVAPSRRILLQDIKYQSEDNRAGTTHDGNILLALKLLANSDDPQVPGLLAIGLGHPNQEVRETAVASLTKWAERQDLDSALNVAEALRHSMQEIMSWTYLKMARGFVGILVSQVKKLSESSTWVSVGSINKLQYIYYVEDLSINIGNFSLRGFWSVPMTVNDLLSQKEAMEVLNVLLEAGAIDPKVLADVVTEQDKEFLKKKGWAEKGVGLFRFTRKVDLQTPAQRLLNNIAETTASSQASSDEGSSSPVKVLLVDDYVDLLDVGKRILENSGYHVSVATDGPEALKVFESSGPFDIVIADFQMPGMNGPQFIREVRKFEMAHQREHTPIALVSGTLEEEKKNIAKELGVPLYLKAEEKGRLTNIVAEVIKGKERRVSSPVVEAVRNAESSSELLAALQRFGMAKSRGDGRIYLIESRLDSRRGIEVWMALNDIWESGQFHGEMRYILETLLEGKGVEPVLTAELTVKQQKIRNDLLALTGGKQEAVIEIQQGKWGMNDPEIITLLRNVFGMKLVQNVPDGGRFVGFQDPLSEISPAQQFDIYKIINLKTLNNPVVRITFSEMGLSAFQTRRLLTGETFQMREVESTSADPNSLYFTSFSGPDVLARLGTKSASSPMVPAKDHVAKLARALREFGPEINAEDVVEYMRASLTHERLLYGEDIEQEWRKNFTFDGLAQTGIGFMRSAVVPVTFVNVIARETGLDRRDIISILQDTDFLGFYSHNLLSSTGFFEANDEEGMAELIASVEDAKRAVPPRGDDLTVMRWGKEGIMISKSVHGGERILVNLQSLNKGWFGSDINIYYDGPYLWVRLLKEGGITTLFQDNGLAVGKNKEYGLVDGGSYLIDENDQVLSGREGKGGKEKIRIAREGDNIIIENLDSEAPLEVKYSLKSSSPVTEQQGQVAGVKEQGIASNEQPTTNNAPGGIDLNPVLLDLQIKRDGNGVPLPLPQQPIETMYIDGFVPIIINITPIPNLPMLLGLADTEPDTQEARPALKAREVDPVSLLN